jgi:probable H4MPT-linked C1 transfer pathway protein
MWRFQQQAPCGSFHENMMWLALDIGGANLKAATARGYAASRAFALWRSPAELPAQLQQLLAEAPPAQRIAVTMTGELADCYATKAEGVRAIVDATLQAAGERTTAFYSTAGTLLPAEAAKERPIAVAASNWHALAAFAVRFAEGQPAILFDIGSTTADIISIDGYRPVPVGLTDPDRLLSGELCYTGVERTPIAAVLSSLPWRGAQCPIASELFACTADAHLIMGDLPEDQADRDTADGRPKIRAASIARLARMVCADDTMFSEADAMAAAAAVRNAQANKLGAALEQVVGRAAVQPGRIILSGRGEFLARRVVQEFPWRHDAPQLISLSRLLGPETSQGAPAYALAVLAEEQFGRPIATGSA